MSAKRPIARITTIEGRRHVTPVGSAQDYAEERAALVSPDTKVGKTRGR